MKKKHFSTLSRARILFRSNFSLPRLLFLPVTKATWNVFAVSVFVKSTFTLAAFIEILLLLRQNIFDHPTLCAKPLGFCLHLSRVCQGRDCWLDNELLLCLFLFVRDLICNSSETLYLSIWKTVFKARFRKLFRFDRLCLCVPEYDVCFMCLIDIFLLDRSVTWCSAYSSPSAVNAFWCLT